MKLSESILLGSTVVTPKAGALYSSSENAGCALGMAAVASGCTFSPLQRQIPVKDLRTVNAEDIWGPWLLRVVIRPCDCRAPLTLSGLRFKGITAYLFDRGSRTLPREMRIKDNHCAPIRPPRYGQEELDSRSACGVARTLGPSELAQSTFIAHVNRKSLSRPQSHDLSDGAAEWQKAREAFEAKVNAKRLRGPGCKASTPDQTPL
jgi:hypothetical protein